MAKEDLLDTIIKSHQDKLKQNPDSLVFVQLADAYRKKGSYDEALEVCREGLTRHPNLLSALLMMGRIYSAKRQFSDAVESLKRVVQREPNNLTAHALLSLSFMALGRYNEAISEYQKILSLNPEDTAAQQALQEALERMRKESQTPAAPAPAARPAPQAASAPAAPKAEPAPVAKAGAAPPEPAPAAPERSQEIPAYAAAEELAARGLHEEAIEALQRILEADPENFMARQKLREVYSQREAMEAPVSREPAREAGTPPPESHADKISDDEILYLLGLMEGAAAPGEAVEPAPPPKPEPRAAPKPAPKAEPKPAPKPVPEPAPEPEPEPELQAAPEPEPEPVRRETAPAPTGVKPPARPPVPRPVDSGPRAVNAEPRVEIRAAAGSIAAEPSASAPGAAPAPADAGPSVGPAATRHVTEILDRLAATEGMRQAYLVAGHGIMASGGTPDPGHAEKVVTLVRMISDVTKRAAASMKHGEVGQLIMFGTEGMVMVSPTRLGVLAAVAGAGVKVGLLRLALNDCLKRLSEVS